MPFTLDLSTTLYFHNHRNGLLLGISNPDEEPGLCREFSYGWTRAFDEAAAVVAPSLAGQQLVGGWAGLYENTPDHNAMIGRAESPVSSTPPGSPATASCRGRRWGRSSATSISTASRSWIRRRSVPTGSPTRARCSMKCTSSDPARPPSVCQKGSSSMITSTTERTRLVSSASLRADFALRLAELYGTEVPAYNTLVEVSREVNAEAAAARGEAAERLGSIDRVTAERHGAIRVGSPRELARAARVFAGFGMHPVGFYDLRDASKSSVPVVSTAFRPIDADELARNPFRVFTSMLVATDRRFFDAETQAQLEEFIGARTLFDEELLELADAAAQQQAYAPSPSTEPDPTRRHP